MIRIRSDVDVMQLLKLHGFSSYRIARENVFGSSTLTRFRKRGRPSMGELERLCNICNCQPGDIIEHVPEIEHEQSPGK